MFFSKKTTVFQKEKKQKTNSKSEFRFENFRTTSQDFLTVISAILMLQKIFEFTSKISKFTLEIKIFAAKFCNLHVISPHNIEFGYDHKFNPIFEYFCHRQNSTLVISMFIEF